MKHFKLIFFFAYFLFLVGCATTDAEQSEFADEAVSEGSDDSAADASDEETVDGDADLNATEEEDLNESEELANEELQSDIPEEVEQTEQRDEFVEGAQDQAIQETPPPSEEKFSDTDYQNQVVVTGVDFKANQNGGTIVIQTTGKARYTSQENQKNKQFILEIENAQIPSRFRKPYNTKEFSGAVGMFQGYQTDDSKARFVVQLKNQTAMSVVQEGNTLLVMTGQPDSIVSSQEPVVDSEASQTEKNVSMSDEVAAEVNESKALEPKTLDDFLTGEGRFYGRKIDIELKNADLREVLNMIAEDVGLNMMIAESVKGNLNLKLRRIPWDQALVIILQSNQLGYIRQGNILRIAPMSAIRAEIDEAKRLVDSQKQLEPLKVKFFNISYSTAEVMASHATNFISTRGKVKSDTRTNTLVVTDIAENLVKIEKLIKRLDTQTPQVLIEARIVEARKNFTQRLGINWANTGTGGVSYDLATHNILGSGLVGLEATLALSEIEESAKILSAPRILTLNNEAATISQVEQIPLIGSTVNPTTGQITETVSYKSLNLSLNVTPQITAEGGVILKLALNREFAGAEQETADGSTVRPVFTRSANSTVLVSSGDTVAIGGIYQIDQTEGGRGLPFLRRIPLLGGFFGSTAQDEVRNELLMFVTPRIINKDKAFQNQTDMSEGTSEIKEM